jgi:hypothetical protein
VRIFVETVQMPREEFARWNERTGMISEPPEALSPRSRGMPVVAR